MVLDKNGFDALAGDLEKVEDALDRVVESDVFNGSPRLQEFLVYVVRNHIEEPEKRIPAKTIAHDVYDRPIGSGHESENIVRVDAGRLRRRLSDYYAGPGKRDPLYIHIDPGGYTPRFELRAEASPLRSDLSDPDISVPITSNDTQIKSSVRRVIVAGIAVAATGFAVGAFTVQYLSGSHESNLEIQPPAFSDRSAERLALFEKSPASVQAVNLAEQARNMIFPAFELEQLDLTIRMFRQAIRKDKDYFGGYAGAAQSLAMFALLTPDVSRREELTKEAQSMAQHAMNLAPAKAWTQSAAAWVAFLNGEDDRARRLSNQALALEPEDGNILDFHALLLLFTGDFEGAAAASDPERPRLTATGRLANRGFYGAALFHLGRYEEAIASIHTATEKGEPTSAPSLAYLTASHQALGETGDAQRFAAQLEENWPIFRPDLVLGRIFRSQEYAENLQKWLLEAGWQPQFDSKSK